MRQPNIVGIHRRLVCAALLTSWCAAATAADVTKANNADALNLTTSWSGGVVPGSGDVALWDATVTSANSVTLGGNLAWQGIRVASPGGNVSIAGGDTLTLGSGGINVSGSTANLAVGTPIALAAGQVWRAATGRTITALGVVSGTAGLEIGVVGSSTSVTSNTFLTTSPQTVFTNQSLGSLTAAAGQMSGAWITAPPVNANGYLLSNTGSTATYWLEIDQGGFIKGAKVQLTQSGADIQAATTAAKYTGNASLPYDFNTSGTSVSVATFAGGDGYGVASTTLYFGTADANGTVTLANVNTYSGPTTVTRGVLTAGAASIPGVGGAFGLNTAVTLADAIFTGLDLANFNTTIGSLAGGGSTGGGVSLGSATLTVGGNNTSTTYGGVIAGSGGLTKQGSGELTLTANNSYDGLTTVTGGTLVLGNGAGSGALGIGAVAVGAGATFAVDRGAYGQVFTNNFSGAGTLRIEGGQDPQFAGDNSGLTGPVVIDGADAQFRTRSANAWSGQSVVTITNGGMASVFSYVNSNDIRVGSLWGDGTVRIGAGGADRDLYLGGNNLDATFSGRIVNDAGGVGSVIKNGTGTQTLSGSNSYGGGTVINAGTLVAANNSALGTAGVTINAGGSLRVAPGTTIANTLSFAGGGIERVSPEALGTVADIVAGTGVSAVSISPTVAWTAREVGTTFSDVLDLTNTSGTVQILQLTYDPSILGGTPEADLGLGWSNGGSWVNAVIGNTGSVGGSALTNQAGSFTSVGVVPTADYLGSWGRDTVANTVWAVVNHNSGFAVIVVPEPAAVGTAVVGAAGAVALLRRHRSRRR